jgi:hypothetical protein
VLIKIISARIETFDEELDEENEYDDGDTDSEGVEKFLPFRFIPLFI